MARVAKNKTDELKMEKTDDVIVSVVETKHQETKEVKKANKKEEYYLDQYFDFKETDLNDGTSIPVENNTDGGLIYVMKSTGEVFEWEKSSDRLFMKISQLKSMLNEGRKFFTNNWVLIPYSVLKYLGVDGLYSQVYSVHDLNNLFKLPTEEMIDKIKIMSKAQRRNVMKVAITSIETGELDSVKNIKALESFFEMQLG